MHHTFDQLPPLVQQALRHFEQAGEPVWIVGGATRDLLLGRPVGDWDFVTAGDGVAWARRLATALGGAYVPLDEVRRVGRVVLRAGEQRYWIDVAQFRDARDAGGGGALEEDLRLRDFSVNAIALAPGSGEWVDPTGGMADLQAGILRAASARTFQDDPLRILRGVRLGATHGLQIEPESRALMREAVPGLDAVAAERVREEWMKLLAPDGARARVELLDALGVLERLLPELVQGKGVTQSPPHSHDVYGHNLLVLEAMEELLPWKGDALWQQALGPWQEPFAAHLRQEAAHELPRWLLLKHVALLHDVGKPATRSVGKDGRIHYYRHEVVGAEMLRALMRRLTFASSAVRYGETVVRHHLRPLHLSRQLPPSSRALYRFFRDVGEAGPDIALHAIADQRGKAFAEDRPEVVAVVRRLFQAFWEEHARYVAPQPLLDGREVMALTGKAGPVIGQMLEFLREQQAQGHVQTREQAEAALRGWQPRKRRTTG